MMKNPILHEPVMVDEVLEFLRPREGYVVLDATIGCGGHAAFILEKIKPAGLLIGIDTDDSSLEMAKEKLGKIAKTFKLIHANFKDLDSVLIDIGIEKVNGMLFDFGISSYQLDDEARGFSFEKNGFLDMRMDRSSHLRAYDVVNRYKKEDLERIIRDLGEERYFRKVANLILEKRKASPIESTLELSEIIKRAIGRKYRSQRIHPATRVFQALRIETNRELENINTALGKATTFLNPGARVCAISFHSLEDRIVKFRFKEFEKKGFGKIITKKPVTPNYEEIKKNPRSRSAKLRVFQYKE